MAIFRMKAALEFDKRNFKWKPDPPEHFPAFGFQPL
jgi:hypothetical protein